MLDRRSLLIANSHQGSGYVQDGLVCHIDGIECYSAQAVIDSCGNYTPIIGGNSNRVRFETDRIYCLSGGYFAVTVGAILNTANPYTISFTATLENVEGYSSIDTYFIGIAPYNNGRSNFGWYQDYTKARWWRGRDMIFDNNLALTDMYAPHTIDLVSNGTDMYLYVNGVLRGSTTITINDSQNWQIIFGGYSGVVNNYENFYSARVYNRALTAGEIIQNYRTDKARFGI